MQIVPQILSCFKIQNFSTPQILNQAFQSHNSNSVCVFTTSQSRLYRQRLPIRTKPSLQAENSTFFWQCHGKRYRSEYTKTRKWKNFFSGEGLGLSQIPPSVAREPPLTSYPSYPSSLSNHPPFVALPKIPSRFTPLYIISYNYTRRAVG